MVWYINMYNQKSKVNGVIHFEDENGGACLSVCDFCTHLLLLCMVVPVFILYLREAASSLSSFIIF